MTEKALRELLQLINQPGEPVKPFEIRYWIDYNGELREKLRAQNSPHNAHRYTRREVELIVEYLCEP